MDAIRISDGEHVTFKAVPRASTSREVGMVQYLVSEPLASDPRNHCVPIYEVFPVPKEAQSTLVDHYGLGEDILVMPRLRKYNNPRFDTFGEAIDFFSQIFEVSSDSLILCSEVLSLKPRVYNFSTS